MAAGCAVVAADLPSVREASHDEAVWVPPAIPGRSPRHPPLADESAKGEAASGRALTPGVGPRLCGDHALRFECGGFRPAPRDRFPRASIGNGRGGAASTRSNTSILWDNTGARGGCGPLRLERCYGNRQKFISCVAKILWHEKIEIVSLVLLGAVLSSGRAVHGFARSAVGFESAGFSISPGAWMAATCARVVPGAILLA
jgi:hypothetical protein